MKQYVLDACALIALLKGEVGGEKVKKLLILSGQGEVEIFMHTVNLLEIYYGFLRDDGKVIANQILSRIRASNIKIVDVIQENIFLGAAKLKATYKISLADAVAIALATNMGAQVVTSDHHEMDVIDSENKIGFYWIR